MPERAAHDGSPVAGRPRDTEARRHVVPIRLHRILDALDVVAQAGADGQTVGRPPLVLHEQRKVGIVLLLPLLAECLLELGVDALSEICERRERVRAWQRAGETDEAACCRGDRRRLSTGVRLAESSACR